MTSFRPSAFSFKMMICLLRPSLMMRAQLAILSLLLRIVSEDLVISSNPSACRPISRMAFSRASKSAPTSSLMDLGRAERALATESPASRNTLTPGVFRVPDDHHVVTVTVEDFQATWGRAFGKDKDANYRLRGSSWLPPTPPGAFLKL